MARLACLPVEACAWVEPACACASKSGQCNRRGFRLEAAWVFQLRDSRRSARDAPPRVPRTSGVEVSLTGAPVVAVDVSSSESGTAGFSNRIGIRPHNPTLAYDASSILFNMFSTPSLSLFFRARSQPSMRDSADSLSYRYSFRAAGAGLAVVGQGRRFS